VASSGIQLVMVTIFQLTACVDTIIGTIHAMCKNNI
jgi:hypothetical protein